MSEPPYPGVYVEEIERGPRPIEGVPTSTSALLGEAERGAVTPRLVTSYKDYQRWFGDVFGDTKFLAYAVNGFFENGGKRAFICRLVGDGSTTAGANFGNFIVRAAGPGIWGDRVKAKISDGTARKADGSSIGFRLQLAYWRQLPVPNFDPFIDRTTLPRPELIEDFDDLVVDESSPDFYGKRVTGNSALATLIRNAGAASDARPGNGLHPLSGGADDPNPLGVDNFKGTAIPGLRTEQGIAALERDACREVALVYAPDVSPDIARAIITHCEKTKFCFAVIDSGKGEKNTAALDPRVKISDSSYAGFYYPWIVTTDPRTGAQKLVPPGGHVLGVYARSDSERGVFKAPANEIVRGVLALEYDINDRLQADLSLRGVNVVRSFPGRGIRVWGARTITSNALWKYVNVRRLFIFLERSIYEGTQWVVFEPNNERLWARVVDSIRLFLRTQWRLGALFGRTEQEAFFVICDRTTMSQDDILNGRLICNIGIAPVRPAEFVLFKIFQNTAEAQR